VSGKHRKEKSNSGRLGNVIMLLQLALRVEIWCPSTTRRIRLLFRLVANSLEYFNHHNLGGYRGNASTPKKSNRSATI